MPCPFGFTAEDADDDMSEKEVGEEEEEEEPPERNAAEGKKHGQETQPNGRKKQVIYL